ncbi:MAG: hypothetical protein WCF36_17480 [Candidatus Nanopelagicales bacterium]
MRKMTDLADYTSVLPYDSEVFGVYQPLLGWRSKKIQDRIAAGFRNDLTKATRQVTAKMSADVAFTVNADHIITDAAVHPAAVSASGPASATTFVFDRIGSMLPPLGEYTPSIWKDLVSSRQLEKLLGDEIVPRIVEWHRSEAADQRASAELDAAVAEQFQRESLAAGFLSHLAVNKRFDELQALFYKTDAQLPVLEKLVEFTSPLDVFDPRKQIDRVGLSPIGIVHLYRQFFFEFDTFLGSPVGHVWLSPGSTVELMEIQARKTTVERTQETGFESITKTQQVVTDQDEISSAVKDDNKSDTKFGMNANAHQGWIGGSADASSTIDMAKTQEKARETTHKHMRTQTDTLATEIRKNFKSTFRTVTETTDTSSKRYTLTNTTEKLINYELRRKMRQVGVQVQDIGTYLCWQTYVDDPGRQLGLARIVHLAKDPDVGSTPPPEAIPSPGEEVTEVEIDIPFVQASEDQGDLDEGYRDGVEVDTDFNEGDREKVRADFGGFGSICPKAGYEFESAYFDYQGNDVQVSLRDVDTSEPGKLGFGIHLDYVNFRGNSPIRVVLHVKWRPSAASLGAIAAQNAAKMAEFTEKTNREFRKAYVDAAIERVNLMRSITERPFEDLREEERIVVYRALIQAMLTKGISFPDDRTRHVVAELLNTIFDIDKMLYFVAPEWWRPRLHESHQALGLPTPPVRPGASPAPAPAKPVSVYKEVHAALTTGVSYTKLLAEIADDDQIPSTSTVSWGGVGEGRRDNYYITGASKPAAMGSSLGWLLQLDGDDLRNAFLNAPWVKAVIPVRPGQERAAMSWLQSVGVEGTDGLDEDYLGSPAHLAEIPHAGSTVTIADAIDHLCDLVSAKHAEQTKVAAFPPEEIDDANKVLATPIDKVYEHGFYPLQGGFRTTPEGEFEVFDQWIEVLPTDQVVPVEVAYDPLTGRQVRP